MPPQRNSAVLDDEYGLEKASAPARAGGTTDNEYGLEPAKPAAETTSQEVNLPSGTERLKKAAQSLPAKFTAPTKFEKDNQIPENYGFTPGHMLEKGYQGIKNIYEFGKGLAGDISDEKKPLVFGSSETDSPEESTAHKYLIRPQEHEAEIAREHEERANKLPTMSREGLEEATIGTGHRIASMVPLVGPWVASHAEQAGTGDVGGAAAETGGEILGGELAHKIGAHPVETAKVLGEGAKTLGKVADKAVRGTPITEEGKLEAAKEQIKTVKPPLMSETEYAQKVNDALPDLQRIAQENKGKIKTPRDAVAGINNRISQIEAPISQQLEAMPDSQQMVPAQKIRAAIDSEVDAALKSKRTQGQYKPEEIQKAKDAVAEFIGDQDKPLRELGGNRRRLNQDADQYFKSSPADKRASDASDATAVAQRAAGRGIRNIEYGDGTTPGELERVGIKATDAQGNPIDLRDVRKATGRLIDIRDHFEDSITRAERTGDWSAFKVMRSGPSLAMGGLGALAGTAAAGPLGTMMGILLGEGGKAWADYRNSKNINLNTEKAFRNLGKTSKPNTIDVGAQTPPPPVAPSITLTPASAHQAPPPVPAMAAVQPTGTVTSTGQLGTRGQGGVRVAGQLPETSSYEIPPIVPQFVREIAPQPAPRPAIKAMLPPVRTTTIPPMVEEPFAREEVRPLAHAGERQPETQLGTAGRGGIRQIVKGELPEGSIGRIGGPGREGPLQKRESVSAPEIEKTAPVEEEPKEVHIKGITAEEKSTPKKEKPTPVEKRFTSEEIADAEGLIASEAGMMTAGDKPGRYFIENPREEGKYLTPQRSQNSAKGQMAGGHWIGIQSMRDKLPFMRENPKLAPTEAIKALRNKDSAAYRNLIEKAVDFNRRTSKPADEVYEDIRNFGMTSPDQELEGIQEGIGGAEPTFNPEEIEGAIGKIGGLGREGALERIEAKELKPFKKPQKYSSK